MQSKLSATFKGRCLNALKLIKARRSSEIVHVDLSNVINTTSHLPYISVRFLRLSIVLSLETGI